MRAFHLSSLLVLLLVGLPSVVSFQSMAPLTIQKSPTVILPGARAPVAPSRLSLSPSNPFSMKTQEPQADAMKSSNKISRARRVIGSASLALLSMTLLQSPAFAADATEHLHTGQKIASMFMRLGLPNWAVLATISAMPVVELRGAVPVGVWMGMPISKVLPICVFGNMTPIVPLMFLLRNPALKRLMAPILNRAEKKAAGLGVGSKKKQWISLAAFVGIPLPGTGAWTGAMGAFLLNMPTPMALSSIFAGVVSAGLIMSVITLAGKFGGLAAIGVLLAFTGNELLGSKKSGDNPVVSSGVDATEPEVVDVEAETSRDKLDFLEYEPYWDKTSMPLNTYKNTEPFTAKIVSVEKIVAPDAPGETYHIVFDHNGDFPFLEGQSLGVIPPGIREKDGKPHPVRLYSICSTRYGDDMTGKTGSLSVRRATYWSDELNAEDPSKKGVCSNFLCDAQAGDEIQMIGPSGKTMLMPEEDPTTDYIMVATGTGVAPYRGFVRRLFLENTPAAEAYKGQAWLLMGVANSHALLYDDEFQAVKAKNPDQFRLDYALSREQTNKEGGKMYIQHKMEEYADEIFEKLENGAHIYFCGLKGMMPGIQEMLKSSAAKRGLVYQDWLKELKKNKQWHVEVY